MESYQKDFLVAEFNKAWDMLLAIDSRRGIFSRYYNILFVAVLAVSTNILVKVDNLNGVTYVGLTLLFVFTYLAGNETKGILESERAANVRYRKKINLIREVFLGKNEDETIKQYLSHTELGIKLLSQESEQPEGVGRTLGVTGSIMGLLQMTAIPEKVNIYFDGGVALGVSGLFIQTHFSLKCRPRHLRHPAGLPGWCRNRGSVNRRDPRMILFILSKEPSCQRLPPLSFA